MSVPEVLSAYTSRHGGGNSPGSLQKFLFLQFQRYAAPAGGSNTGNTAGMPSLVEGVSAKTPQLALHLGGYGECTYQFFARGCSVLPPVPAEAGKDSHGGVLLDWAGGVIQLQLVAADTVQERRISRGKPPPIPARVAFPLPAE